jgi:hypothetical protein
LIGLDTRLPTDLDGSRHRSVYLPVIRDRLPDVLDLFDFAEPSLVTGDRETTNVPVQALYLMNSPFVQGQARALAARLVAEAGTDEERIRRGYLLCLNRLPEESEQKAVAAFFRTPTAASETDPERVQQLWQSFSQVLLLTAEFRNLD